jgi:hypothetical protein
MTRFLKALVLSIPCILAAVSSAPGQQSVLTQLYDNARTGANLNETQLNTSNVNVNQFGKLWAYNVDGSIYAQPLYVPAVTISGQPHNVLYVATMNDKVYAFDADTNAAPLWMDDFTNPGAGITPVPISDITGGAGGNIVGNVGIEGTPVIDPATRTMYLVARTKENGVYFQRLHALDITTGAEKFSGPVVIQGSVPGTGDGSIGGTLTFDPLIHNQRPSLALVNGMILIAWGSHEDLHFYHGWVMVYSAQNLSQLAIYCDTPSGSEGGIWQSGRAPAVDASGNVYYATGNGTWDGTQNFSDSILKLSTANNTLSLVDWFTPDDWAILQANDWDLGSSGPMLIPGTDLLVSGEKQSLFYVMHSANLGHEQSGNGQIVQTLNNNGFQIMTGPVFWNRTSGAGPTMYNWAEIDYLKAYRFNGTTFNATPISQSLFQDPKIHAGGVLALSANGSTPGTGIVWASVPTSQDAGGGVVAGTLRAFDANDLTVELWDSNQNSARDSLGNWAKFNPPTVVNGKVYMATFSNAVNVYGQFSTGPDFTISGSPKTQYLAPGGSTPYTVSTGVLNGFSGTVNLSVTGLPTGATASFNPASIAAGASSTLTVTTTAGTPTGNSTLTITGTSGSLTHTATVTLAVTTNGLAPAKVISVDFVGQGTPMAANEVAGVVAKSNWNSASGFARSSPLALMDENGNPTNATVIWTADNPWVVPTLDQPGNVRMMKGYLDDHFGNPTTITVSGLTTNANGYQVYVYADGDNGTATRSGNYQISGTGITTTSVSLTDAANTNFSGTFTQANNSNGNYVLFTINATGFTLTVTPGTSSSGIVRAPVNGIQIVPVTQVTPDFSISAAPGTASVTQGSGVPYTATVGALNGFSGSVNLGVSGLPTGATASFNPASVTGSGTSTLTVMAAPTTPTGIATLTITGTSTSLTHSTTVTLSIMPSGGTSPAVISIDFVGTGTAMGSSEVAGVLAKSNWNNAGGISSSSPLALVDETGSTTAATVTWKGDNLWASPILDQAGNVRMMKGYLDDHSGNPTTVTVSGLPANANGYQVYVYADGDNGTATRSGNFQISGPGITTTSISLTDAANTNFSGTFTQANNSNGNYVLFAINATGFTLTATAGAASDGVPRAPLNGIQIVPVAPPSPDFTISAAPGTASVPQGGNVPYTVTVGALNGFTGSVNLSVSGLPTGATASFNPASVTGAGTSTITVTAGAATPTGSVTLTITGTSAALVHSTTVALTVTPPPDFTISATPPTASVVQGSSVPYTVTVGALNGFSGSVGLGVTGLPTGATASFNPTSVSGSGTSTLTVTAGAATPTGSVTLTITGTSLALVHSTTVTLTVTPPPDFTISATPPTASVLQGSSVPYTVTVGALNGFTGSVNLGVSGLPTGATASFNPASVTGSGNSTLTVTAAPTTPTGIATLTITGTSISLTHSTTVTLNVIPSGGTSPKVISIDFVGTGTAMGTSDVAGVVAKSNWNNASGISSASAQALVDETGSATTATVTWKADNLWALPIVDQAGNVRMMKGYIDTASGHASTVTVAGLPSNANGYQVYVHADGDNGTATRTGNYQISGTGITTTSVSLTDAANANFSGTFTQANNSSGNYIVFTINATGFTLTATPGAASDPNPRAPLNGIQIVPIASPTPDFSISATPSTASVPQGGNVPYTVSVGALNGFSGSVNLSATGLPTGATALFNPTSVSGSGNSTLTVTAGVATPTGSVTLTITGTSASLVHSTTVTLNVTPGKVISIDFVGSGTAMGASEMAGVVAKNNWNNANGNSSASALALVDETGSATTATFTWNGDNLWALPIVDQLGNLRMMKGYLDTGSGHASTVTVAGLPSRINGYKVYAYADGDNGTATRSGVYQISGAGITTTNISLTDAANTNFGGTFTQANNSSGNYAVFTINATGFTLTATPGAASDPNPRAPLNGIQIVPQ